VPASRLHTELKKRRLSDGKFAELCGKHRTEIWAYRHGTRTPNHETAMKIIAALDKLGVELTLEELYGKRSKAAA
jgi:transcriptional regulator with XRE-family HTH domain